MEPETITSFKVDHTKLTEGIYISRTNGDIVTYDLRTRRPNDGNYMDNITMHSVEHMVEAYIRSSEIGTNIIYFGPMGSQTGFYLLVRKETPEKVLEVLKKVLKEITQHKGEVFGKSATECGNYRNLDLESAVKECERFLKILEMRHQNFKYEG